MLVRLAPIILAAAGLPSSFAFVAIPLRSTSNSARQTPLSVAYPGDKTETDTEIDALMAEVQALEAEANALEAEADAVEEEHAGIILDSMFFLGDVAAVALEKEEVAAAVAIQQQKEAVENMLKEGVDAGAVYTPEDKNMESMIKAEMAKVVAAASMAAETGEAVAAALEATPSTILKESSDVKDAMTADAVAAPLSTPSIPEVSVVEDVAEEQQQASAKETAMVPENTSIKEETAKDVPSPAGVTNTMRKGPAVPMSEITEKSMSNDATTQSKNGGIKTNSTRELTNEPAMQMGSNLGSNGNVESKISATHNNEGTKEALQTNQMDGPIVPISKNTANSMGNAPTTQSNNAGIKKKSLVELTNEPVVQTSNNGSSNGSTNGSSNVSSNGIAKSNASTTQNTGGKKKMSLRDLALQTNQTNVPALSMSNITANSMSNAPTIQRTNVWRKKKREELTNEPSVQVSGNGSSSGDVKRNASTTQNNEGKKRMSLRELALQTNQMNGPAVSTRKITVNTLSTLATAQSNNVLIKEKSIEELTNEPDVQMSVNGSNNVGVKRNASTTKNTGGKKKMSLRELALQTGKK